MHTGSTITAHWCLIFAFGPSLESSAGQVFKAYVQKRRNRQGTSKRAYDDNKQGDGSRPAIGVDSYPSKCHALWRTHRALACSNHAAHALLAFSLHDCVAETPHIGSQLAVTVGNR
eukprot:594551-Pleurochrysis_carterae.AAC.2